MAYQVDKFNGTFLVSVADGTVDTTTDLRLLGKNYAGYGEVQNENFLHLLENFANTSPPPKAVNGQVWFDSATKRLKFYDADNTKWRTTGGLEVSSTAPVKMNVGDFWYDTSADQLYSWNGNAFVYATKSKKSYWKNWNNRKSNFQYDLEDCPLTGYCADFYIIDKIVELMTKNFDRRKNEN
jgi:hypothetical protein